MIAADLFGWEPRGMAVQVAAFGAAFTGAVALRLSERFWPDVQEGTIGVAFVLAASVGILLLAGNPHGGEHLQDLLVGQILWVGTAELAPAAALSAVALALWFGFGERLGRLGFYLLFAWIVTVSVQLVGVYLVFASLIVPALATPSGYRVLLPLAGLRRRSCWICVGLDGLCPLRFSRRCACLVMRSRRFRTANVRTHIRSTERRAAPRSRSHGRLGIQEGDKPRLSGSRPTALPMVATASPGWPGEAVNAIPESWASTG